ncbi:MAG TPA: hypothetical protein EYH31_14275, partial [Anaerolineae bacterium]|nr:hypothetical protein [Anaerolineae bacterium]
MPRHCRLGSNAQWTTSNRELAVHVHGRSQQAQAALSGYIKITLKSENGGPGGLAHTLRQVPEMLSIARDMERLCPEAW